MLLIQHAQKFLQKRSFELSLTIFVLFCTFFYPWNESGAMSARGPRELIFILGIMSLAATHGCEFAKIKWIAVLPFLSFFLIWDFRSNAGIIQALCVGSAVVLVGVLQKNLRNCRIEYLTKLLGWVGVITSAWVYLNTFGLDPTGFIGIVRNNGDKIIQQGMYPVMGNLDNPSLSAALIACLVPFMLRLSPWLLLLGVGATYSCNSAMGMASLVSVLLVMYWQRCFVWLVLLSIVSGSIGVIYKLDFFSLSTRDVLYKNCLEFIHWHGRGFGAFYDLFRVEYPSKAYTYRQEHSFLLTLLSVGGIAAVALVGYLLSLINVKLNMRHDRRPFFACFIGLLVNSTCNLTFNIIPLSLLCLICYAILISEDS